MKKIWEILVVIIKAVMSVILGIFKIEWQEAQWEGFFQFVKFGLVGASNTIISYVTYAGLVYVGAPYLVANVGSFVISVLNSFYWNNKYVFTEEEGEKRSMLATLAKTFIAYGATGLILSSVLLVIWIDILHISPYIGPIINLIVTIPLNFIINKFWAFKKGKK